MIIPDGLRIHWMQKTGSEDDWRAKRDAGTFSRWEKRQITSAQGAALLSKGNECRVTVTMFEANAIMLGYYPRKPLFGLNFGIGKVDGHNGDTMHEVEPMAGYEIHRFYNAGNVPYSAIYVDGREKYSCERPKEKQMIEYYYATL